MIPASRFSIRPRRFSKRLTVVLLLVLLSISAGLVVSQTRARVPPYVQIHSVFSPAQGGQLYGKLRRQLRGAYWQDCRTSIAHCQFKNAWKRLSLGPGDVRGIVSNGNGGVLAYSIYRDGSTSWTELKQQ